MNILFLGDSLIEYFDWQGRFPAHHVSNLGVAGESVGGLLSRLERVKGYCPEADMIFIMTGINNIAMDDHDFFGMYREIMVTLHSFYPGANIFINSLLSSLLDFIPDESIQMSNDRLKILALEEGAEYLDIHSRFIDTKGRPVREYLLEDGVHISSAGYEVWARAVEEVINKE